MTKARDLANIISGGFTADDIPNIDASKITSGTFADARISNSSVSQHATSFDDNKIVNDISTLALRQASDQNKSAYNTNSQSVDVFQDDTGIDTNTNTLRTSDEYVGSIYEAYASSTSKLDWFNPTQQGGGTTKYQVLKSFGTAVGGIDTYNDIINITSAPHLAYIDPDNALASNASFPFGSYTNVANSYFKYDFKETKRFSEKMEIGKTNYYGDLTQYQIQYSTDGSTYYNVDFSSATQLGSTEYASGFSNSGGNFVSGTSGGLVNVSQHSNNSSNLGTSVITLQGIPTFDARYIQIINKDVINTQNANVAFGIFQPYEFALVTASNATGNFTGTTITALSSVSEMGAIITYQDFSGTNALNTDIVLQLSADGGSNYSTATLTALPDFSTGIKMAKVNDLAVTAGTQLKYKISFANQASGTKEARIRGVALQY
jgi:hypothetical protein